MEEKQKSISLDQIRNYIAVGYPIAVFIGYYDLSTYYLEFNIEIYNYLDFSEILLSFLHNATFFLAFIGTLFGVQFAHIVLFKDETPNEVSNPNDLKPNPNTRKNKIIDRVSNFKLYKFVIWLLKAIETNRNEIAFFFFLFSILFNGRNGIASIFSLAMLYISIYIFASLIIRKKQLEYKNYINIVFILAILLIFINDKNSIRSKYNKQNCRTENSTNFKYNNTLVQTDSLNLYIGETKNYFFFYNCEDSLASIKEKKDLGSH